MVSKARILKGITVTLHQLTQTGVDGFNEAIYTDTPVDVENVLVAPSSSEEVIDAQNLWGKKAVYTLAIPKGDTHEWEGQIVEFFGARWRTFGYATKGIDDLIPLDWNTKVQVERYG